MYQITTLLNESLTDIPHSPQLNHHRAQQERQLSQPHQAEPPQASVPVRRHCNLLCWTTTSQKTATTSSIWFVSCRGGHLRQLHSSIAVSTKYISIGTITEHLHIWVSNLIISVLFFISVFEIWKFLLYFGKGYPD